MARTEEDEDPLFRPYILASGRERPETPPLDLASLVVAVAARVNPDVLEPEQVSMLRLCRTPLSVGEVASRMRLPLGVARILLQDLIARNYAQAHAPAESRTSPNVLQAVLSGLQEL